MPNLPRRLTVEFVGTGIPCFPSYQHFQYYLLGLLVATVVASVPLFVTAQFAGGIFAQLLFAG